MQLIHHRERFCRILPGAEACADRRHQVVTPDVVVNRISLMPFRWVTPQKPWEWLFKLKSGS